MRLLVPAPVGGVDARDDGLLPLLLKVLFLLVPILSASSALAAFMNAAASCI